MTQRRFRIGNAPVRIGLVLSGGGLRGAGHVGVLQQLVEHDIPIDIIVGSSAGAIVAAYYAAVGLSVDDLIRDAARFRGRHLVAHSLSVRLQGRLGAAFMRLSGLIPKRLAQLESATFDRLHHNVGGLGIACHDVASGRPCYFTTGCDSRVRLSEVVRASASIPGLFPAIPIHGGESTRSLLLTDGGVSDGLPVDLARRPPLGATHLIVSDCRGFAARRPSNTGHIVYVRPRLPSTGTLWAPASTLTSAVREGQRAVTNEMLTTIRRWGRGQTMQIDFNRAEAELLRDMLQHRIEELDKEINRTDSLAFKRELQNTDRTLERVLGRIAAALEQASD